MSIELEQLGIVTVGNETALHNFPISGHQSVCCTMLHMHASVQILLNVVFN